MIRFDFGQHFLKARPVKIRPAVSVVHEENGIRKAALFGIGAENTALVLYGIRFPIQRVFLRESAV